VRCYARAVRMWAVALAAVAALAPSVASAQQLPAAAKPALRLVSFAPLTLRGTGFAPRERVRLDLSGAAAARRRVVALASGSFAVRFDGAALTQCDFIRVAAVGSRGIRAGLKHLPSPACMPA
jgi:hypothetical protein